MATALAPPDLAASVAPRGIRRRRKSRAFAVGLAVSAALHVLVLATVSFHYVVTPRQPRVPLRAYRVDESMHAYNIEPIEIGIGVPEPEPLPQRPAVTVPVAPMPELRQPPLTSQPAAPAANPSSPSAVERLSRGFNSPELLQPLGPLPPEELTEAEWLRLRLAARLGLFNDSLAAEAAAKLRATDWTYTDKNGKRWGVSPGEIHLGSLTLPLPFGFTTPPGRRDDVAAQLRSWEESQSQASRVETAQTFEQRVKAIRARQDAARDSARKAGGGG